VTPSPSPRPAGRWLPFLLVIVLAVLAVGGLFWRGTPTEGGAGPEQGQIAPDFSARKLDGGTVRLSDFRGRPVVLNFFASWCDPCKAEAPGFQALYEQNKDRVTFLSVSFHDTTAAARAFAADYGLTFPVLLDDTGAIGAAYRVRSLPTTFFIRPDGVIQYKARGAMTQEFLALEIEALLGK